MAVGFLLVAGAAAAFGYGYGRARWRALAEAAALGLLGLGADAALAALGFFAANGDDPRVILPGTALFLALPVVLPLVAGGVVTSRSRG